MRMSDQGAATTSNFPSAFLCGYRHQRRGKVGGGRVLFVVKYFEDRRLGGGGGGRGDC